MACRMRNVYFEKESNETNSIEVANEILHEV